MDKIPGRRPDDIKSDIRSRIEDHLTKLSHYQDEAKGGMESDIPPDLPVDIQKENHGEEQNDEASLQQEILFRKNLRKKAAEQFERVSDGNLENNFVINRRYKSRWFTLVIKNVYAEDNETVILYECYLKSLLQKLLYTLSGLFFPFDGKKRELFERPLLPVPFLAFLFNFNGLFSALREYFDRRFDVFDEKNDGENLGLPGTILLCRLEADGEKYMPLYSDTRYQGGRMAGTLAFPPLPEKARLSGRINLCISRGHVMPMVWDSYLFSLEHRKFNSGIIIEAEKEFFEKRSKETHPGIGNLVPVLLKPDMSCVRICPWF